ncbi:MAG TPA: NUDIX domain-containing protein [Jiangellaceae bacterium]|nr:NUDIX domain-containing protein [Jiangellaceae bacterium]
MTLLHRTDGDGWVDCSCGRRHWGRFGAAGLMLVSERGSVLLQHRAAWSHEGGTWALPGGARSSAETALQTALREAFEEAAVEPDAVTPRHAWVDDHGPWSYTTVVAHATGPVHPTAADRESVEISWVGLDEVADRPLHPAFAGAWPALREQATRRLVLVIDAANVVGSRPDGWWHDRAGATARLRDSLSALAVRGMPAHALELPGDSWWPDIRLVVEGRAAGVDPVPGVTVLRASHDGDAVIALEAARAVDDRPDDHLVVVTADRELRARVGAAGARVVGPKALLGLL